MKPTDEARRLRDEIAEIYRERSVMDLTKADEIINKVMDAAVGAIHDEYPDYHEDAYICIQAIDKLRP